MIQVGDCFKKIYGSSEKYRVTYMYKVIKIEKNKKVVCNIYLADRLVGSVSEYENILLKYIKLSLLEKELM